PTLIDSYSPDATRCPCCPVWRHQRNFQHAERPRGSGRDVLLQREASHGSSPNREGLGPKIIEGSRPPPATWPSRGGLGRAVHKEILQNIAAVGRSKRGVANSAMNFFVSFARLCLYPNDLVARLTS